MSKKYLSCAETAKLVRAALKEAFLGVKFSVVSSTYSGGASIGVRWIDGPNSDQVEAVTGVFEGSYFDGSIDYKGSIHHMIDGQEVSFGADWIRTNRDYSNAAVQRAIDRVMRRYAVEFSESRIEAPSVDDFNHGRCFNVCIPGIHNYGNENLQSDIRRCLARHSDRLRVEKSKTAARVMIIGDDGYSRACGGGFRAVVVEDEGMPNAG